MTTTQPSPDTPLTDARIDAAGLAARLAAGEDIRLLDVRTPAEFETAHIPGSYNVPLDTLGEHAAELHRHLDQPVVLVCRSGMRASRAGQTLAGAGMTNLVILDGGMQAWDDGGRDVRRGQARWDIERQVRLVAGGLVLTGIVASLVVPGLKYLSGAVGLGLVVAAATNTCMMGTLLSKLPYNRSVPTCDVGSVVAQLTAPR